MASSIVDLPWIVSPVVLPMVGALVAFVWPTVAKTVGLLVIFTTTISLGTLCWQVADVGIVTHNIGNWAAPLGIVLRADGIAVVFLLMTITVGFGVSLYSSAYFDNDDAKGFWPLWLFLLAGLNALFLSADLFNQYVALELIGLSGVALVALHREQAALAGAIRYLLATLFGSLFFLFGVVVLYHSYGTVDLVLLTQRIEQVPAAAMALALIAVGLSIKAAVFPLHFWLPPAHANAPAPVSALLSALVVKAAFYVLFRLWYGAFSPMAEDAAFLVGILGACAVLWGSAQALRQTRVKLLIAYSTIAQIGYLFIGLGLSAEVGNLAWSGVVYVAVSHAIAKAAMFLAAGNIVHEEGHDRIADLGGAVQRLPLSMSAFALAGISIMGLPPSGGFVGKWLLLQSSLAIGYWHFAIVIVGGGLLAAGYVFKVLAPAFVRSGEPRQFHSVPRIMEWTALALAGLAILMNFLAPYPLLLIEITSALAVPPA